MSRTAKGFFSKISFERRQKYVFFGTCTTGVLLFAGNFMPQTLLLSKYKEIVTCYRNGIECKVPDKVLRRFNTACDLLQLSDYEKKLIKPFTVFGLDTFHAGSTKSRFGAFIGIPTNYFYDHVDNIEKSEIKLHTDSIKWNSDHGKLLEQSLVLTEDEQVFGIAREILQVDSFQVLFNSIYSCGTLVFAYTLGHLTNKNLMLKNKPFGVRGVLYTLIGFFTLGIWSFLKDSTQVHYDIETDKKLCSLGPELINAGVRFYEKLLNKNIAVSGLTGKNIYTAKGNEHYLLRQKSLPLTYRKSYFSNRLKEYEESQKQTE